MSIHASGLAFRHADGELLFSKIHFSIHSQKIGLVGRNGTGKSTLLKLIAGHLSPSEGSLQRRLTVVHCQFSGGRDCSGGEAARAVLDEAWRENPDCLLLDEPTNHLDSEARRDLHQRLRRWRKAVVIASHDPDLLESVDEIWELRDGTLHVFGGGYLEFLQARESERVAARRELTSAEAGLRRAREGGQRARERQQKRMSTAKRKAPDMGIPRIAMGLLKRGSQRTLARLEGVHEQRRERAETRHAQARARVGSDERPRWDLPDPKIPAGRIVASWEDSECRLQGPRRVALVGPNGGGKTTRLRQLVRAAAGERVPAHVHAARVAYLDQELLTLDESKSLLENLRRSAPGIDESALRVRLGRVLFSQGLSAKTVRQLSGGERLRATLAAVLTGEPAAELLLLDEPTNHLDRESKEELKDALASYRGALIVVSHDRQFIDDIEWDEIWEIAQGTLRRR